MTEDGYTPERWAFGGLRAGKDGKRIHAWFDDAGNGKELWYGAKGSYVVGYIYDVEVRRGEGGSISRTTPVFTGERFEDDDKRREWMAKDRVAGAEIATKARERSAQRQNELDAAMEPILEYARKLAMPNDRDALAAYVLRRIHQAGWK